MDQAVETGWVRRVPAAFFGMVLGLAGLANAWRVAHVLWGVPAVIGEVMQVVSAIVWAAMVLLYLLKWVLAPGTARVESEHPVQCCFIGLAGVATMLIAQAALPYSRDVAVVLFGAGALFTLCFALWRTGLLWRGGRDAGATTAVLYLPAVAGEFVTATTLSALGYPDWGQLAFGAGLFSWLAIESVLLHRLYTAPVMPPPLRPTLGIQLAPPAVGAVAYLAVSGGGPGIVAHALVGYGLLQSLLLLRMLPWIAEQPFAPSYWAFTFGADALATAAMRMAEQGDHGAVGQLAPWLFGGANVVVIVMAIGTFWLLVRRRLLPA